MPRLIRLNCTSVCMTVTVSGNNGADPFDKHGMSSMYMILVFGHVLRCMDAGAPRRGIMPFSVAVLAELASLGGQGGRFNVGRNVLAVERGDQLGQS